ncbi:MAG: LLM class flavin-dependent oxidoreductase, partial [Dermatophilaceae bacterium]
RDARRAAGRGTEADPMAGFDVVATTPVVLIDDVEAAAEYVRPYCALYIGGMGTREQNFYNQLACRMGFEKEAEHVQELYLAGRHREAAAAVPLEFIDETALIGSAARVAGRIGRYADAGVTSLAVAVGGEMTRDQATATLGAVAQLREGLELQ